MKAFDIGLSALRTHQQTLATLGHNIANASTPGYHRQRAELVNRQPMLSDVLHVGTGVEVKRITRLRDSAVETALLRNSSLVGYTGQILDTARQIEAFVSPSDTSIHSNLSEFFNRLEKVANAPQDMTVRNEFLSSAQELAQGFSELDVSLTDLDQDVRDSLDDSLGKVNQLLNDIAAVNSKIFESRALQREPNDLLDRRDRLITELTSYMDAEVDIGQDGREFIVVGSGSGVIGQRPVQFELAWDTDGKVGLRKQGLTAIVPLASGKIRALMEAVNQTIPEARVRLNTMGQQVVHAIDQQHAQGMPDTGPFSVLLGQRSVSDVNIPLQDSSPVFPLTAGNLYVTITEKASGNRRTEKIAFDPSVDSLTSLAAKLEALNGVAAAIDPGRRTISINAESGFAFDFAGRPDNVPDVSGMTGTSVPAYSGSYTGDRNDQWTVTFSGPGTIGQTPGLTAVVTDSSGQVIARHNVGLGYEAGTDLGVRNGMSIRMGSGTVAATDTASLYVITNSDETGLLSSLGLNSLFEGSSVGDFNVRREIFQQPQNLAGSVTGMPGDSTNFARLAGIRDTRFGSLGNRTFTEEMADITADAGLDVQAAESQNTQAENLHERLEADKDRVSGVDINEEMLKMLEVERSYQAATRFITTINNTLEELFRLVQ